MQVLPLDEPFEGLSPAVTQELFEVFDRLRQEIALVIVDHHLDLALGLSDRTVVLERGTVTWNGVSTLLKDDLDLPWLIATTLLTVERVTRAIEYPINLARHDKIVFMQPFDLLRA